MQLYFQANVPDEQRPGGSSKVDVAALVQANQHRLSNFVEDLEAKHGGRVMLHVPVDDRYAEAMTNEHLTAEESVDLTFVFDASQSLGVDLSGGETTSEAGAAANSAIVVIDVKMGSQVLAFLLGCCCCYCCCCCCCFACPCVLTTLDFAQVWCVLYAPHCFLFEHHHHCSLILLLLVLLVLLPPT